MVDFDVIDFSLPRDISERILDKGLPDFQRLGWEVISEVLGEVDLRLGGWVLINGGVTVTPLSGHLPFLHVTLFKMAFRDGRWVTITVFILIEKLARTKELWRVKVEIRWVVSKYGATSRSCSVCPLFARAWASQALACLRISVSCSRFLQGSRRSPLRFSSS